MIIEEMDSRSTPASVAHEVAWVSRGIAIGAIGASAVALFFLVQDMLRGEPFWTPNALGTALFLGRGVSPSDAVQPALVVAYSAAHATVFLAAGLIASACLVDTSIRRLRKAALAVMVTGTLFTAITVAFLLFAAAFGDAVTAQVGAGNVALANLFAAAVMAGTLVYFRGSEDR